MQTNRITWLLAAIGSYAGSYIPQLWGAGIFSFSGLIFGAFGAIIGIWIGFKLTH